jgi:hypothetical protein
MSFSPEPLSDIEAIRDVGRRYSHALDRLDADGMHSLFDHLVELDPGGVTARGEILRVAYLCEADRPVLHTWLGRYLNRDEKRGDEWRIAERVYVHEGSRVDDPLTTMPFPVERFRPGSFARPWSGRPIRP